MLLKTIILILLGLQNVGAQTPPPPELPLPPTLPAPPVPAQLPAAPAQPGVPTETAKGPATSALAPIVEGNESSDLMEAESDVLRPTKRDPFSKPQSLLEKEIESVKPIIDPSVYIDMRIEPIRRFPLRNYVLVGIIFDVDDPKAMVKDPDNNMHLLTTRQRIGNQEGMIVKIERGELVVEEKGKLISIKLHK